MRDLGPGSEAQGSGHAWLVKREALVDGAGTADMLIDKEAIGAAADDFGDRRERRCRCQTLRHDGRHVTSWSCQSLR